MTGRAVCIAYNILLTRVNTHTYAELINCPKGSCDPPLQCSYSCGPPWGCEDPRRTSDSLSDDRGKVVICDVAALIDDANDGTTGKYDAILLDVDNGPDGIVRDANYRIYSRTGLAKARDALNRGGILAIWSAAPDHKFTQRLKEGGFDVEVREVRARPNNKGPRHTIWFARKP